MSHRIYFGPTSSLRSTEANANEKEHYGQFVMQLAEIWTDDSLRKCSSKNV